MKKNKIGLACLVSGVVSVLMLTNGVKILVADSYVRGQGVELPGLLTVALWVLVLLCIAAQVLLFMLYRKWQDERWAAALVTTLVALMLVVGIGTDFAWNRAYTRAAADLPVQAAVQSAEAP